MDITREQLFYVWLVVSVISFIILSMGTTTNPILMVLIFLPWPVYIYGMTQWGYGWWVKQN